MLKLGRKHPKQGRSKVTVDAIFGAVTHILSKDGPVGLTTNKIAEVAGVSVGSLYQYFKNKESIFEAILLKFTEDNLNTFEKILKDMKKDEVEIRDVITLIVNSHFETILKMEKVASVLFQYAPQIIPHTHFKKSDERIIKFLMEETEKHHISVRPVNKEQAFFVCVQAVRSVLFMSFLNRKAEERKMIMEELIDMLSTYLEPIKR